MDEKSRIVVREPGKSVVDRLTALFHDRAEQAREDTERLKRYLVIHRHPNRAERRARGSRRFQPNGAVMDDLVAWSAQRDGMHYHATKGWRGGAS
jgi:hypothetical protein